jgi:hypothetical protein
LSATTQKKATPQGKANGKPQGAAAKAARAETKPEPKQITFRDRELQLAADMPATFAFDATLIEAATDIGPYMRLLHSVLGDEQFVTVRHAIKPDDDIEQVVVELVNAVFEQYGLTPGEASASQDS